MVLDEAEEGRSAVHELRPLLIFLLLYLFLPNILKSFACALDAHLLELEGRGGHFRCFALECLQMTVFIAKHIFLIVGI